jgi:1,2-phenylacetyl-CoA epoxidase catalytic subunit
MSTLSAEAFVSELDSLTGTALARIAAAASRDPGADVTVERLLFLALKNELEATECAASFIPITPEIDVKLALARQAGDEAKHFKLIEKRLGELGADATKFEAGARSPLLVYLLSLPSTVERVAAAQFTREALAIVRNAEFVRFCESQGDAQTAALYRDIIQPDEAHHHALGRSLLMRLATTDGAQEDARRASLRTLELAEELQEIARLKLGVSRAPGC